ncbi:tripeptidyl peptidase A [Peniophora sp. CONT]|nr:tripeptidyl peptidase A [Peniophora sp. CONT]
MLVLSAFVAALVSAAAAAPSLGSVHKVKESVQPPRGWVRLDRVPGHSVIPLRFALPQDNFAELEKHLYEISDPDHERYGSHLSKEEVEALVAPHPDSLAAVNSWLASHGIPEKDCTRSPAQDWVGVNVPVALAEKMLDTEFHAWKHTESGDELVRTTSYSLPEDVHAHIELVHPTTYFSTSRAQKATFLLNDEEVTPPAANAARIKVPGSDVTVDPSCNTTITVDCVLELYNAVGVKPSAKNGNEIAVTGYLGQNANIQDLNSFYSQQVPQAVNSSFKTVLINGGVNNQTLAEAGGEANLDTQFAFGISFPTPATFFSTGGQPPFIPDSGTPTDTNEPYTAWLDFVLAQRKVPQTISTSYGDDEQTVPRAFANRVCAGFAQLGARGTSLMFSSGDGGVGDGDADPATQSCFTNDGRNATRFIPGFPASCPFVTAVGATQHVPEVAVSRFFSGGGFSDFFSRPSYQDKVVPAYLATLPKGTFKGLFNPNGRAIPDVSAQGDFLAVVIGGRNALIGGTSASSPTFAGIISLVNDARLSKGLPSLGFLNPLIYKAQISATFNDITVGHNPGCGTEGFNTSVGWDPVTGFGTPNFGKLKAILAP